MPNTYTLIEKITVGAAGASSVTFTSIPQTYTDLEIRISARSTDNANYGTLEGRFNGDTGNNYTSRYIQGLGSGTPSSGSGTTNNIRFAEATGATTTASTFANTIVYIPNYTSSNKKSVSVDGVSENNGTQAFAELWAGLWDNTAAITSISITANIAQYSTFYLYGVAKEGVNPSTSSAPYATGGDSIVFDGTYWIHTFTSSGTFTPKKALTCDYLVVAGGGSGGNVYGYIEGAGGGGAGGFRTSIGASALSMNANTGYTVTIGAGGAGGNTYDSGSNGSDSVFSTITSTGGGRGAADGAGPAGGSGGGGGAGSTGRAGGAGNTPSTSPSQGNNGGTGFGDVNYARSGGGGGGGGAVGANAAYSTGGNGGAGSSSSLSGSSVTYAGGGGGATAQSGGTQGTGGSSIGGNGSNSAAAGNGVANTGSGGGGQSSQSTQRFAGSGGSGIVIVRYAA